jgi:uncharacterized membrane protein
MEQQVKIAAKLYQCRDTAKRFFRDEYEAKLKPYKNIIESHQKKFNLDVLPSVLELCSFESVRDNGMATMLFMAAAVEMVEHS